MCGKSFTTSSAVNRHMVVQTGEKSFACEMCGKSFTQSSTLSHHKKKCVGQSSSQQNISASASEIQFVECGETIKEEIKKENEMVDEIKTSEDPLSLMSEHCDDIFVVESELRNKQETEDL